MVEGVSHSAIVRVSCGLTGHVVALGVTLDDGFQFEVQRPLVPLGDRRLLRGAEIDARAVDEHERSFELLDHDANIIGSLRLGQRVILDGEKGREPRGFGLVRAAA